MLLKIKESYAEENNPIVELSRTTGKSQSKSPLLMKFLQFIIIGFIVSAFTFNACTSNTTQAEMPEHDPESDQTVTSITFDNMGATAYVVLGIDGDGATANLDEENTEISLRIGDRFRFENVAGASNHPLDFRNSDRDKLLGQSNGDGIFDDDAEVDVQTEGNIISFTLTSGLASELSGYVCSFHPGMNGAISTTE